MQRAPGEERLFRVTYGDGDLEFMLQPWFDLDVRPAPGSRYDIVIAGVAKPDGFDLAGVSRAARRVGGLVRDGGAIVLAAQLDEDDGAGADALPDALVVIAASEAPEAVRVAGMRAAVDVEEGLDIAYEHIGRPRRASVVLIPRVTPG
ncbi:MAG TPA: hypothetical protein VEU77_11195 [Candidatus Acidoferrales bacterium]|nr:hypothetical protein [Candidatus Acidoferrales bacterium]